MRRTTLLAAAALLGCPGLTLAQNTPEENNPNVDAPFVRNIRADRPGQTVTAQVLRPGRSTLTTGTTAGLYWHPMPAIHLDVSAGQVVGDLAADTATVGAGLTFEVGK